MSTVLRVAALAGLVTINVTPQDSEGPSTDRSVALSFVVSSILAGGDADRSLVGHPRRPELACHQRHS